MKEADKQALLSEMDALMRSLRQCETQATAIQWMTRAYNAMDGATQAIKALERMVREEAAEARGLVFQIGAPKLEIVQSIPTNMAHRRKNPHEFRAGEKIPNYQTRSGETVVYPEFFLHPGLKPAPRAWTRADTLRLENAAKMGPPRIVRKSQ
jgi:hypothetical protein